MKGIHRIVATVCPTCHTPLTGSANMTEERGPIPGDFTLCFYCGMLLTFEPDMQVRTLEQHEWEEIPATHQNAIISVRRRMTFKGTLLTEWRFRRTH